GRQESVELIQRDFDGKTIWRFDHNEELPTNDGKTIWSLRQHHYWQRADFPSGYYSPESAPACSGANTLVLTHTDRRVPAIAGDVLLGDDRIIELSPTGQVLWQWIAGDHIDELGFDATARASIRGARAGGARGDGAGGAGGARGAAAPVGGARGDGARAGGARGDGARAGGGPRGGGPAT